MMKKLVHQGKYIPLIAKSTLKWLGLSIMVLFALTACESQKDQDLAHYMDRIKEKSPRPLTPIPAFIPLEKFVYPENDVRRSPFKQKAVIKEDDKLAPNTKRPRQLLEQFPLDALKFVGVLKQGSDVWGLISQPGGEVDRVKIGDYMGQNYGKITNISDTSLTLEETVRIGDKWEKKMTTFTLNASQ
jgi:type IV pilus assembly protein PilP